MNTGRLAAFVIILTIATSAFAGGPASKGQVIGEQSSNPGQAQNSTPNIGASTQLAQLAPAIGVMVNLGGTYSAVNQKLYQFNEGDAAARFASNVFTGEINCIDQTGAFCSTADAPEAPSPDAAQAKQAAVGQACAFLMGTNLQPFSYTQLVFVSPVPNGYTWKEYVYHYVVTPNVGSVQPLTAWNFVRAQRGGSASVQVTGQIVNELVTFPNPGTPMYAFMTGSLVSNLQLSVNNKAVPLNPPTTVRNCPGCQAGQQGSVDFVFTPNAGIRSPYTGTMADATYQVKSGHARAILNSDSYGANDNGGPDGSALQMTTFRSQTLDLAPGSYRLLLTGNSAGMSFMMPGTLQILSANCAIR